MLEVEGLHTYYGASHIVQGLDLHVDRGEVVSLLGRNGAGKTTTMRSIVGLTRPARGQVRVGSTSLSGRPPYVASRAGIAFVPSGRRVFANLTVRENLLLAARTSHRDGPWTVDRVDELFPKLATIADRRAGLLSGGEQQMLKLGRALLSNPAFLLLDEPTEGLSPAVVSDLGDWLDALRTMDLGVLMTEQNAIFALRHSDRGYIMEKGRIRASGSRDELLAGPALHTYLGVGAAATGSEPTHERA